MLKLHSISPKTDEPEFGKQWKLNVLVSGAKG